MQKALNSALEDVRTLGNMEGGIDVQAKDGFGLFLTYNPETGIANADLEVAVRDRCKMVYFQALPAELKARIALLKTKRFTLKDFIKDGMELRGLQKPNGTLGFLRYENNEWYDTKTKAPVGKEEVKPYLYFNREKASKLEFSGKKKQEYYQVAKAVVNTLEEINQLRTKGTKVARELRIRDVDEIGRLNINLSSPRLTNKIMEDYILLRTQGYSPGPILGDVVNTIIDYTVPAGERELKIGEDLTIAGLVEKICESNGIISDSILHTLGAKSKRYSKERLVDELTDKGFSSTFAEKLVEEYA